MHQLSMALLFALGAILSLHAQNSTISVEVKWVEAIPMDILALSSDNPSIRDNTILNEGILDLVTAYRIDSILPRKKQRHRVFGGGIISMLGWHWLAIDMKRQTFIGTLKNNLRVPNKDSDKFTEYDVNWDLVPHREPYIGLMYRGYQKQYKLHRHWKGNSRPEELFTSYPTDENLHEYRVHCELTPSMSHRQELNDKFYPVIQPMNLTQHINFGEARPTVGMYGPFVSDCNHSCHTELHPYEWLWWLDLHPQKDANKNEKRWLVGFFREYSNRFKGWSAPPQTGHIKVPFLFPVSAPEWQINLDHLVYSHLHAENLPLVSAMPDEARQFNFDEITVDWTGTSSLSNQLFIRNSLPMTAKGAKFWLSDVATDGEWVMGYFNIAVSIEDVYTVRITTSY